MGNNQSPSHNSAVIFEECPQLVPHDADRCQSLGQLQVWPLLLFQSGPRGRPQFLSLAVHLGAWLRDHLEPLGTILAWCSGCFRVSLNPTPLISRAASPSVGCTPLLGVEILEGAEWRRMTGYPPHVSFPHYGAVFLYRAMHLKPNQMQHLIVFSISALCISQN